MNSPSPKSPRLLPKIKAFGIPGAAWLMLLAVFIFHFYLVAKYAVDFPYWDDWCFIPEWNLPWFFSFHNEHRVVTWKLLVFFLYNLNSWNIAFNHILNFLIFGGIIFFMVNFVSCCTLYFKKWIGAAFCVFLLSPVASECHHWAEATIWHFTILFGMLASCCLFHTEISTGKLLAGAACLILCMYSLAAGLILSATVLLLWILARLILCARSDKIQRMCHVRQILLVAIPYLAALGLWFVGYHHPEAHMEPAQPWSVNFWNYFCVMLLRGFAFPYRLLHQYPLIGITILAGVVTPVVMALWHQIFSRREFELPIWRLCAFTTGIVAIIATTAYGRGNFTLTTATSGRYAYFVLFLIPLSASLWHNILDAYPGMRKIVLVAFWLSLLLFHGRKVSMFNAYHDNYINRTKNLELLAGYYRSRPLGDFYLPDFWVPLNSYLDKAEMMNLSFYRKLKQSAPVAESNR